MPYYYDESVRAVRAYHSIEEIAKRTCPYCQFVFAGSVARCPRCEKIVEPLSRGSTDTDNAEEVSAAETSK